MNSLMFLNNLLELLESEEEKKIEKARQSWEVVKKEPGIMRNFREAHDWSSSKEEMLYRRLIEMGVTNEAEIWSFRTGRPLNEAPILLQK